MPDDLTSALARLPGADKTRPATAASHVETVLRKAILSGALAGGTPLRQEALASAFGVSRMPIREALTRLEAQALVSHLPNRGAVVAEISAADAADVTAIRAALEPAALRLSVPRLRQVDLDTAAAVVEDIDRETDPGRMGELNRRFHMALYGAAGHPRLLALVERHLVAADAPLRFQLAALGRAAMSNEDHWAMWAAAREGRTDEACAILERHIRHGGEDLAAFLAERVRGANEPNAA